MIYFYVHDHLAHLSDRSKRYLKIKASVVNLRCSSQNDKADDISISYRWFKGSPFLFQKAFDTHEVRDQIRKFMNSSFTKKKFKLLLEEV